MSEFAQLAQFVYKGAAPSVKELTQKMVDSGTSPMEIITNGLLAGMDIVSPKFKNGEMFVPEVMMSARALGEGMKILKPLISGEDVSVAKTIVIGTVSGDLHDIGKNLVVMILESGGFNVVDLGVDVSPAKFVAAVKENNAQVVGMSALLTTTMLNMKETIDLMKEEGLRDQVKIMIGGAPVSQSFADEIGADAYCADAMAAKDTAGKFLK
ncbi:Cobalamin (vitamin B12)-binding domain protein [Acididesulfobacillus acetoxydans]|uniref:Cobalamin (Vitamin B12)-binding domain protein n=1 Tax=Acididesulfobacillus acetoxydans TaxID=1561005 RepID=A0A8S0Y0S6_9FIRM|nr:corrinoid protein [Acididesulfobacillus acetoxydans]CAA7603427.1 Cobalamin (vitamin B12)-binding domain protein [Acididesulfobacillus acetoxydans]CEJ07158.1 Dimethylamine corrinoid protein 2 [Acididesulfobacillus acetoxydans]